MNKQIKSNCILSAVWVFMLLIAACGNPSGNKTEKTLADTARIVSINGTTSEILSGLGFEKQIVGVDVASTYPESLASIPRVGHSRQLAAEGILALNPNVVVGTGSDVKPELADQLRSAGIKLLLFEQEFSPEGSKHLIHAIADSLDRQTKGDSIITQLEADLAKAMAATDTSSKPRVLFIYARGTGTMMVAGDGTPLQKIIELAGGQNAVSGFADYKPLTAEALVAANPDVILLFTSGLQSLGGIDGLLAVQGVKETNAGKNKKVVEMDGQFLTGFSPRLGKAVEELAKHIH